ncbi:2'-5' RNA ligase family protein [Bosea sp. LjRoot90]|uniref:2'-5' RNA ligase family protein n=1 Tax=Bosea sp. LjRoot90 TaxID=3342342 RepID=UPI003ECFEE29
MLGITLSASSAAQPFWKHVDEASALEDVPSIRALGYRPHLTLTRYATIESSSLQKAMEVFDGEAAISVSFDRVEFFDTDLLVLWLAPQHDQRLFDLHARLHAALEPASLPCDANYSPSRWRPHLTIALAIDSARRTSALTYASRSIEAFTLTFDGVDCVSWPPVRVLHRLALAEGCAEPAVDAARSR